MTKVPDKEQDQLLTTFAEIRRVGTPWCAVRTNDPVATVMKLLRVKSNGGDKPRAGLWDCMNGCTSPVVTNQGEAVSDHCGYNCDADTAPQQVLRESMLAMLPDSVLFMVVPDNSLFENSFIAQAILNLRDEYKASGRTLVFLGIDPKLPLLVNEDIPILDDPLPDVNALTMVARGVAEAAKRTLTGEEETRVAGLCLGLTTFAAEEGIARNLRKSSINYDGLSKLKQQVVEDSTNKALTFDRLGWNFEQMGGHEGFKGFVKDLFAGPCAPTLVVRIDEIDKSITAASAGQVADNTGVSQDILKVLLTALEDNSWMGLLAVGAPGTGKTLASVCTGNQFGVKSLAFDMGAVKGSLVGESEQKVRRVIDIIKTTGGKNVLFMATANRLDTMPPELQRRFWLGTWFWDLPDEAERKQIWDIQKKAYGITDNFLPDDTDWTGADVRNCCRMAWACKTPLVRAAERITVVSKTSAGQVEALRATAEKCGFRSTRREGPYARAQGGKTRRLIKE
jgi:hypothetical protein